ncbi:MAG TPA: SpoIIE family protein phosphatase, partial [Planctomycetota bacterium]|nr:SpoIIE family protein phosphatase [Planctomycetota bacterium]
SVLGTMPWFYRLEDREDDLADELKKVMETCQLKIEADALENPSRTGMATTLTMAYVLWPHLYVVHVGDARCYLLRNSTLEQITSDHTTMIAPADQTSPEKPLPRTVLWNVIGGKQHEIWPDVHKLSLEPGDTLLLATDGLVREVPDDKISEILLETRTAEEGCRSLVDAANQAGGRDNITVIVIRFGDFEFSEEPGVKASATVMQPEGPADPGRQPPAASERMP